MRRSKSPSPLIVIGLGNPGPKYEHTRHNVGYRVIDQLICQPPVDFRRRLFASYRYAVLSGSSRQRPIIAVRYDGFMNNSGSILPSLVRHFRASHGDFLIVVDNMDLLPGVCRIRKGGGTAGHNGLKSLVSVMGTGDFMRLYIGVGRPDDGIGVVEHVLGEPDPKDDEAITEACQRGADAVRALGHSPFDRVAEELNRRDR